MLYALPFCPLPLRAPPVQSPMIVCLATRLPLQQHTTRNVCDAKHGCIAAMCAWSRETAVHPPLAPAAPHDTLSFVTHSSTLQFHALKSVYGEIESLKSIAHSIAEPRRGKNTKYTCDTGQGIWQACFQSRATMAADRPPRCRLRRERVEGRLCLVCVCGCSWEGGYVCLSSPRAFWQCCGRRMK